MEYRVNGQRLHYEVSNRVERGSDVVLAESATDLTTGQSWHDEGFVIAGLFARDETMHELIAGCETLIRSCWRDAGLELPGSLPLTQYHSVADNREKHLRAVQQTKLLDVDAFPCHLHEITDRVSAMVGHPLVNTNPYDGQRIFHFRVVRPGSGDNNPLHRDVWLEDYDDCINLYIPVAGSDERSSLVIVPGSHRWPESRIIKTVGGAVIGNVRFNVPAVAAIEGSFHTVRPDPRFNSFLIFSPYLIHGGAVNLSQDQTRISIEMRYWKA